MKESIHKYYKVGIVSFMAYPSTILGKSDTILETLKKTAVDDYFDAIEINWIHDEELRKEAKKLLDASHLTICYGAQPRLLTTGLNPNDICEEKRIEAENTLIQAVDEANELGAKGIAFLSGKWDECNKDKYYQQLLLTTRHVCEYAKTKNMLVELEVFDYDIAKKSLIGPAKYAAKFAQEILQTCDNFGLLVDLSHIPMCRETSEFVIHTLKPYITHFHIGNTVCKNIHNEGYGDEHQRFGFPNGSNDVEEVVEFLKVLKNEGFMNSIQPFVLSFEVKPWKDENSDVIVANAKRVLNRAWALLED